MQRNLENNIKDRLKGLKLKIQAIHDSSIALSVIEEFNQISLLIHNVSDINSLNSYDDKIKNLEDRVEKILQIQSKSDSDKISQASKNDEENAKKIQASIRGFLDRRKYQIKSLKNLESYRAFVVGNDPIMPSLSEYKEEHDQIALIATSGMRSVELACALGNKTQIPKIIIVDNSWQVHKFWDSMRELMSDHDKSGTLESFYTNLDILLNENTDLYVNYSNSDTERLLQNRGVYLPTQDIKQYFSQLFNIYGFDYVRQIITHTSLIKQSWANPDVFLTIKNLLDKIDINKIYMYPSNIVSCIEDSRVQDKVLENIQSMNPVMTIHTDSPSGYPENVIITRDQSPEKVKKMLFRSVTPTKNNADDLFNAIDNKNVDALKEAIKNHNNLDNITQFSIPLIMLITLDSNNNIDTLQKRFKKLSNNYKSPILIKIGDNYSMFGFNGTKWCLTHNLYKAIMSKITSFPSSSHNLSGKPLNKSAVTTEILNEIMIKYAHRDGHPLLHQALLKRFNDGVQILLSNHVDPNTVDKYGSTPLHVASSMKSNEGMIDILLGYGANPNAVDYQGHTPLHIAAGKIKSEKMCELLLNANAHIDVEDNDGFTPLDTALYKGNMKIVKLLLHRGAKITDTTYEIAKEYGYFEKLEKYQAKLRESLKSDELNTNDSSPKPFFK